MGMEPFRRVRGIVAPLDRANVDTDQIIPKQFLKRIGRTGFGDALFFDWRYEADGRTPRPDFPLNRPRYRGASILLTRANFGCGSSREHAPWALMDYGFRAILAPSFADIFRNNCYQNGLLPVELPDAAVDELFRRVAEREGYALTVDLEQLTVSDDEGLVLPFTVPSYRREALLEGRDEIARTLALEAAIARYEATHRDGRPAGEISSVE
jgi:3-isopropylmalate/(R)-2-methylmalate dehydratase small subunit